jgi:hypothetical protein
MRAGSMPQIPHTFRSLFMKLLFTALAIALAAAAMPTWATNAACDAQAAEKKLAGAAKTSFLKKCEADAAAAGSPSCEAQATQKKLAGAAKTSFVKKCESDAAPAGSAACETQATEKKLSGAARTSFVKKCVADAK